MMTCKEKALVKRAIKNAIIGFDDWNKERYENMLKRNVKLTEAEILDLKTYINRHR